MTTGHVADSVVELDDVSVKYGNNVVLENVSMKVEKGDVVGIVGPKGGGKTTLLNAILGNIPITHGTIRLFGEDVHNFHAFERIGYVAQTAIQFDPIFPATVEEIVSLGCIRRTRLGRRLTKDDKKAVDNAIHLVGLEPYKKRKISQLSGGQKQRIFIAKALVKRPDLLVLDEATTGLDVCIQDKFVQMIRDLRREMDITLLNRFPRPVRRSMPGEQACGRQPEGVLREHRGRGRSHDRLRQAYGPHFTFMFHHDHHECDVDRPIHVKGV
jgi:zinc transport system ATP-binding protein